MFTGKRLPKSPIASPIKGPHPIAPKPPQGKVRVTRLNQLQGNAAMATAALMALMQQTSPQKTDSSSLLPALQAIFAKSPPDKRGRIMEDGSGKTTTVTNGQEEVPKITVKETPQKTLSPPSSRPSKRTGSVALFYRKVTD